LQYSKTRLLGQIRGSLSEQDPWKRALGEDFQDGGFGSIVRATIQVIKLNHRPIVF